MNILLVEIRSTLGELQKGLKGELNMSESMMHLHEALTINQVPGRNPLHLCSWEKLAWWSLKDLPTWYDDLLLRVKLLHAWTEDFTLPQTMWLPGLFNPMAFVTAVTQVTARKTKNPLDAMTIEVSPASMFLFALIIFLQSYIIGGRPNVSFRLLQTHVTTWISPDDACYYPEDGAFIHGLYIEGARWEHDIELDEVVESAQEISGVNTQGFLAESKLKDLRPRMPVMFLRAVVVDPDWVPESVGYMRNKSGGSDIRNSGQNCLDLFLVPH